MAGEVSDARVTFIENLQEVVKHLKRGQYKACAGLSTGMTHFSWLLGQREWVFVCEVFEAVFINMYELSENYEIPEELAKSVHAKLVETASSVLDAITNENYDQIFQPLKEMRFGVTDVQLKSWATHQEIRGN